MCDSSTSAGDPPRQGALSLMVGDDCVIELSKD
jgi:hypothetical protein